MSNGNRLLRLLAAVVLVPLALSAPGMGFSVAERYKGEKLYGVLEGDWFFLFGFLAAAGCLWAAAWLVRSTFSN